MTPFESSLLAMLAPVAIALVAWLRAETANRAVKASSKALRHSIVTPITKCDDPTCSVCGDA